MYRFLVGLWNPVSKNENCGKLVFRWRKTEKKLNSDLSNLSKLKMLLQRLKKLLQMLIMLD